MFGRRAQRRRVEEEEARIQHMLEWVNLQDRLTAELGRTPTILEMVIERHMERADA
jgi:hypothetical protein